MHGKFQEANENSFVHMKRHAENSTHPMMKSDSNFPAEEKGCNIFLVNHTCNPKTIKDIVEEIARCL